MYQVDEIELLRGLVENSLRTSQVLYCFYRKSIQHLYNVEYCVFVFDELTWALLSEILDKLIINKMRRKLY